MVVEFFFPQREAYLSVSPFHETWKESWEETHPLGWSQPTCASVSCNSLSPGIVWLIPLLQPNLPLPIWLKYYNFQMIHLLGSPATTLSRLKEGERTQDMHFVLRYHPSLYAPNKKDIPKFKKITDSNFKSFLLKKSAGCKWYKSSCVGWGYENFFWKRMCIEKSGLKWFFLGGGL